MTDWFGDHTWPLPAGVEAPDFAYWCRMPSWQLEEAVSLVLGAEPKSAKAFIGRGLYSFTPGDNKKPSFEVAYGKLLELANRTFPEANANPVPKGRFVNWLVAAKINYHKDLKRELEKSVTNELEPFPLLSASTSATIAGFDTPKEIHPLGERERTSLLKLVIGMAVGGYAYHSKAKRSDVIPQIRDDLQKSGIPLDDQTIRKYLTEAAELLPSDLGE